MKILSFLLFLLFTFAFQIGCTFVAPVQETTTKQASPAPTASEATLGPDSLTMTHEVPAANVTPPIPAITPSTASWTRKKDIPVAVSVPSVSAAGGKIYVIGGRPPNGSVVQEYDPTTNTWERKADMPTPRVAHATSVIDGKIYVIGGGSTGSGPFLPTVEVYDPATDSWTRKSDMPSARYGLSTSVIDGKVYAIGGNVIENSKEFSIPVVECYDPATDTWTRKADMPTARFAHSTVVAGGKIYAVGGFLWPSQEYSAALEVYDVDADSWAVKADMPVARVISRSANLVNGEIYAFGGEWNRMPVLAYNPATDTWREVSSLPVPSDSVATAEVDDTIFAFAGAPSFYTVSKTVYAYDPGQGG